MALSTKTGLQVYREAARDSQVESLDIEKIFLVNRAANDVVSLVYDIVAPHYVKRMYLVQDTAGNYDSGQSSYSTVGSVITMTTPLNNLVNTDVGKIVSFSFGSVIYSGTIASVLTTHTFVFLGNPLPGSSGNISNLTILNSNLTTAEVSLSGLNMMWTTEAERLRIEFSVTPYTDYLSFEKFKTFRPTASPNKIVWTYLGGSIFINKGSNLQTYGFGTLYFPSLPTPIGTDTNPVDVPDGACMELVILKIRKILCDRSNGKQKFDETGQVLTYLKILNSQAGNRMSIETVENKAKEIW